METTKTNPKNKIKNIKKGQPIKKQLKTEKKIDQNIQKKKSKKQKQITLLLGGGGGNISLLFSCYALAALQPPTINQDIHHKTAT